MRRRGDQTPPHETDEAATLLLARVRLVVLTAIVLIAGLFFGEGEHPGLQYVLAFVAMPASAALALGADRLRPARVAVFGAAIDVGVFTTAVLVFPDRVETLAPILLLPVLMAGATAGRELGLVVGGLGIAIIGAAAAAGTLELPADVVLLLIIAMAVSLTVVGRADARLIRFARSARSLEARSARLLEHLTQPVVGVGDGGRVTVVNDAARELFGELGREPRCQEYLDLRLDGVRLDCSKGCALLDLEGSRDAGGVEATACGPGVGDLPVLVSVAEVPTADGDSLEWIHSIRDITRLKLADEAKTLFLATATHELKTPLTVIRGFLETIDRPDVSEDLRASAMGIMRQRAGELSAIIDRILLASRIESGQVHVDSLPIDAVVITRERVAALAAATGRTISFQSSDDTPAVSGDAAMLGTVVDHLVDNACKYTEPGGVIAVTVEFDDLTVGITVRDEGHGMTPEDAAHCFERFWQADPTSRRRVGGTGIGLFIVRSLVESMRGTISVTTAKEAGSTFSIVLRRADAIAEADATERLRNGADPAEPEPSIVREFMRQIGVESKEAVG